jgi:hypothetical protein
LLKICVKFWMLSFFEHNSRKIHHDKTIQGLVFNGSIF